MQLWHLLGYPLAHCCAPSGFSTLSVISVTIGEGALGDVPGRPSKQSPILAGATRRYSRRVGELLVGECKNCSRRLYSGAMMAPCCSRALLQQHSETATITLGDCICSLCQILLKIKMPNAGSILDRSASNKSWIEAQILLLLTV